MSTVKALVTFEINCNWTPVFIELPEKLLNASKCFLKYFCLLVLCEILSTRKYFGYAFKNICDRMGNVWIYISMIVWVIMNSLRVLMPGYKFHFDCRVSPCLPPLCLPPMWTIVWRHSCTGLPVEGCQIQSCFPCMYYAEQGEVVKWVVCLLHQCITWLSPQRCLTLKKMSDTSICGTVQRRRRLNLENFSS